MDEEKKESSIIGAGGLFKIASERLKPWRTPNGDVFVDLWVDTQRFTVAVRSEAFVGILYMLAAQHAPGKLLSTKAVEELKAYCVGNALASGRIHPVHIRVGADHSALFYDLGDDTRELIKWGVGGWSVVRATGDTPKFFRPAGMLPQVRPQETSEDLLGMLGKHVRTRGNDIYLIAAWLVGAFKHGGPYPVLIINGEQGAAKSTTTRFLRRLVDPHSLDLREPPTNIRDLVAAVKNSFVLAVDNMSVLQGNLSDSLCRISTGTGALGGRALYTDSDEAAFTACRPIVLNGIPSFAEREDLVSRSINVELPAIDPSQRMDDDTFWARVEEDMPKIMGALFNCVARAKKGFPDVRLNNAPRMANFARWAFAGLGDHGPKFLEAFSLNKVEAAAHFVEHNEVAQALIAFMRDKEVWHGSWIQLLRELGHNPTSKYWPTNSLQLRNRMTRMSEDLRKCGLEWRNNGREGGTGRSVIEVRRLRGFIDAHVLTSVA